MRGALVVVATVGVFGCSPYGGGAFNCQDSSQCSAQGQQGTCQANGLCSFPDPNCASHERYGSLAGELSYLCVGQQASGDDGGLTVQLDASMVDAAPTSACYGNVAFVRECLMTAPMNPVDFGNKDIDTNPNSADCAQVVAGGNLDACVIAGSTIHIGGVVTAHGSRPLVFVSNSTIVVDGKIDVASHRGGQLGPSANTTPCPSGISATTGDDGGGGGYGGSFGGAGGNGGIGAGGGNGGRAPNAATPSALRGGCPGSNGADSGGARGDGGGAVHLIAKTSITINGTINASGAGGGGGSSVGGGGGGGAGGMIGLDAPAISISGAAVVFANGGGGGEGGGGGTGRPGGESDGTRARGGKGGAQEGGDGGDGTAGAMLDGRNGSDYTRPQGGGGGNGGGGGGAGGAGGVVRTFGALTNNGLVSPTPTSS
jgi:hypothetical protein